MVTQIWKGGVVMNKELDSLAAQIASCYSKAEEERNLMSESEYVSYKYARAYMRVVIGMLEFFSESDIQFGEEFSRTAHGFRCFNSLNLGLYANIRCTISKSILRLEFTDIPYNFRLKSVGRGYLDLELVNELLSPYGIGIEEVEEKRSCSTIITCDRIVLDKYMSEENNFGRPESGTKRVRKPF